jgi:thymidylate synthase
MNTADKAYNELVRDILQNGKVHHNRTGIDTLSVFGRQIRFNLQDGFPLLTGKKVWFKGILHELLWFLGAVPEEYKQLEQTNIKYLVDNNVNIWNEWPYKKFSETRNAILTLKPPASENYLKKYYIWQDIKTQDDFVKKIKTDWDFARSYGNLGPVYGKQWTNWTNQSNKGINQIQQMIDRLKTNPDCRRIIVNAWQPAELDEMLLPPCHYSFQFKSEVMIDLERQTAFHKFAKDNLIDITGMSIEKAMNFYNFPTRKLHLLWNQRSCDYLLGAPFNIASYATLLMMFSQITNHVPAELIGSFGDVHLYENHLKYAKEQLTRKIKDLPHLKLNRKIENIFDFRYNDFEVVGYNPHPNWKNIPIAV